MNEETKAPQTQEEKKRKRHWVWIAGLTLIGIILMLVRCSGPAAPSYNPIEIDLHAERVEVNSESAKYTELTAMTEVTVSMADKTAKLYFVNPAVSEQDVVLSLKVGEKVIGTSGRLEPGYMLEVMNDLNTDGLVEGTYEGSLVADAYDKETGERQMVNMEINVDVIVVP